MTSLHINSHMEYSKIYLNRFWEELLCSKRDRSKQYHYNAFFPKHDIDWVIKRFCEHLTIDQQLCCYN